MYFYLIASVAARGSLRLGYDTGVISGALLFIRQIMALSPTMMGLVVAIALAGAAVNAAAAENLSDHRRGRRHPDDRPPAGRRGDRRRTRTQDNNAPVSSVAASAL